jgi:hypothetical protein
MKVIASLCILASLAISLPSDDVVAINSGSAADALVPTNKEKKVNMQQADDDNSYCAGGGDDCVSEDDEKKEEAGCDKVEQKKVSYHRHIHLHLQLPPNWRESANAAPKKASSKKVGHRRVHKHALSVDSPEEDDE